MHYRISGLPIIMPLVEKLRSFITRVKGRGGGEAKIERDILNVKMGIDFF